MKNLEEATNPNVTLATQIIEKMRPETAVIGSIYFSLCSAEKNIFHDGGWNLIGNLVVASKLFSNLSILSLKYSNGINLKTSGIRSNPDIRPKNKPN